MVFAISALKLDSKTRFIVSYSQELCHCWVFLFKLLTPSNWMMKSNEGTLRLRPFCWEHA